MVVLLSKRVYHFIYDNSRITYCNKKGIKSVTSLITDNTCLICLENLYESTLENGVQVFKWPTLTDRIKEIAEKEVLSKFNKDMKALLK